MGSLAPYRNTTPPYVEASRQDGWCSRASHDIGALRALSLVLSATTACLALVGCAGIHLHDDQAAKVAGQARTAFKDSGADQPFTSERDLIADQNRRQLAAARQFTTAFRDAALINIVGSGTAWHKTLTEAVSTRLTRLISDPNANPDRSEWTTFVGGVLGAREEVGSRARTLSMVMNTYALERATADPPSQCPSDNARGGAGTPKSARAQLAFSILLEACKDLGTAQGKVEA